MLNEGLILEPNKASHVQFMNDVGVFFAGFTLLQNDTKNPIEENHVTSGPPFQGGKTTRYKGPLLFAGRKPQTEVCQSGGGQSTNGYRLVAL